MKSNKAAKSTIYPSWWAKAKSALQAIPTIMAALTPPLREFFKELETISPSLPPPLESIPSPSSLSLKLHF